MLLNYNLKFEDLYNREGILKIHSLFEDYLHSFETNDLLEKAKILEDFVAKLFNIENEVISLNQKHNELSIIYYIKRNFVQRKVMKNYKAEDVAGLDARQLKFYPGEFSELKFANLVKLFLDENNEEKIKQAELYTAYAIYNNLHKDAVIFKSPHKLDYQNLVECETVTEDGIEYKFSTKERINRADFDLISKGASLTEALDQAHYCIYCHNQKKDSCSKGLREKTGEFKISETKTELTGCPLEEKISEMNLLKSSGNSIAALAVAMIDNPMLAATGDRICNDCMKSCIYQKQEPVNIPQIESRVFKDVIELPWGFEIYSLLSRWNPLKEDVPVPLETSGYKVLVVGQGPAGFTLSHYLLNLGHEVVAIDGLKIEPTGVPFEPIKDVNRLFSRLDERVIQGFGGVIEYGITSRYNKNYLLLIRLLLERRKNFKLYSGVRFGSNITYDIAREMGFDHIALAMGAGRPNILNIKNGLARGVRTASDFLMSLQLGGAYNKDSLTNLEIRLPIIVIGGGLTAIDTATESLAYYYSQVRKVKARYKELELNEEDQNIIKEFLEHADILEQASREGKLTEKLLELGGVKICYRGKFQDSPSYRLNHEEIHEAFKQGVTFVENVTPEEVLLDEYGYAKAMKFKLKDGGTKILDARTILIAAGTSPNTIIAKEDPEHFKTSGKYFRAIDENEHEVMPENSAKPKDTYILTAENVSFLGDLHPSFSGNVVKAMASAKAGHKIIDRKIRSKKPLAIQTDLDDLFTATVHEVNRLTPNIVEIVVKSKLAAQRFEPGQFFRLQNFKSDHIPLMENMAMTGAKVDVENGLVSMIALEMGASTKLCHKLQKGEKVVLMGPTGEPTEILRGETVVLIGGGLGNAVLFSIGKKLRENGNKVIYFAGYKKAVDIFKQDEIEEAADQVIWCCDEATLPVRRDGDMAFCGNIIEAIKYYGTSSDLTRVDRIIAIGSDRMMRAVKEAKATLFKKDVAAIASINSPMQCMMKEICAQCLQKHVDPDTGLETYVYSCSNQDQDMDKVCFDHLADRLAQNRLLEKIS